MTVEKRYGEAAHDFVEERIDALVLRDDINGVDMWLKIAAALDQLSGR